MLPELNSKNANIESIVNKTLKDSKLLSELLDGLQSKNETFRYNCYKVLMSLSKTRGELLYPSWDYFLELLNSDNSYQKMSAVHLLTNLVKVDTEDRFQKIFDKYYSLLDDKSVIVAIYVAQNSAQIVKAKPHLENHITDILLNIDNTHHPKGRKELIKAGAIEAFIDYFPDSKDKAKIMVFVKKQQNSESPKTKKMVKTFLKKWGKSQPEAL
jgi:hypothetical protein